MDCLDKITEESGTPKDFSRAYFKYITKVISCINEDDVASFIDHMILARDRGSTIYFIGNGGSAATATHFANDIGIGPRSWQKPFKALSLTDNQAVITAIGNDYGYEYIFEKQLELYLKPKDIVVAISASGNSPNLLRALKYANQNGAITFGLTAFDGGEMKRICQYGIHVPCAKGEYGPAEDAHMILDHLVATYLKAYCIKEAPIPSDDLVEALI